MLNVKSLRVDYEGVTAVSDADFNVPAGQIYGLVGPNGAGKTSTLKALAGVIEPTYGHIEICGLDLEENPEEALRHIGFMPDFPPVYEHLKVWEYLEVFAAAYFISSNRRLALAREWAERVDLAEKWEAYIHTLSRGMKQRLVLAKTLLHDPEIVLLDEPASGLDPIARAQMRNILKDISTLGKAVMISSHILTELSDFCSAIGVMEKGRMVISGSLEEIRSHIGMKGELIIHLSNVEDSSRRKLFDILQASSLVAEAREQKTGEFSAIFLGAEQDGAGLLAELVKSGLPIVRFLIKKGDVEDIFFKIGARETS